VTAPKLTPGQARLLARVKDGPRRFNYRAAPQIKALETLGLATADWDADLDATKGRLRWRILVTPTEAGRAWLAAAPERTP
jgi:hypothetical protein